MLISEVTAQRVQSEAVLGAVHAVPLAGETTLAGVYGTLRCKTS
jgi:hypothetical protein